jgi:hypothetical protein
MNLALAAFAGIILTLIFYAPLFQSLKTNAETHLLLTGEIFLGNLGFFFSTFFKLFSVAEMILYLAAAAYLVYKKDRLVIPLLCLFIGPILIFSMFNYYFSAYLYPACIAPSLMAGRVLSIATEKAPKRIYAIGALILVSFFSLNLWWLAKSPLEDRERSWLARTISEPWMPEGKLMPDLEPEAKYWAGLIEEKHILREGLKRHYPELAPAKMAIVAQDEMVKFTTINMMQFFLGLDRPALIPEYLLFETFALAATLDDPPSDFRKNLVRSELVILIELDMGKDWKPPPPTGEANEADRKKYRSINEQLLNQCTKKEHAYSSNGKSVTFLKPVHACFSEEAE